jgi:hypothetical protein
VRVIEAGEGMATMDDARKAKGMNEGRILTLDELITEMG